MRRLLKLGPEGVGDGEDVLVAAAAEIHQHDALRPQVAGDLADAGEGVGGFEGGDDALQFGAELEGGESLVVGGADVLGATDVMQERVLRADAGVVEAGADGVGVQDLAVLGLQQIGAVAVQHARAAAGQRGRVLARV
jgi:hypothetical protein